MTSKVKIRDEYLKVLPIDTIHSRAATATIFAFFEFKLVAIVLLQRLSHRSRAYLKNADGLNGFLIHPPVYEAIIDLTEPSRWQIID